ncbi:MAG: transketolase [Bacilli bacterium]|nr:transketolase [Bacilli bacterium]
MPNELIQEEINQSKIIDQIRCLAIDMISEAKSGHPGIALGAAPIVYALYANHLRIDPKNPNYFNRDRFILSAGHASALLYATLYMAGYDLTLDDLKAFRQIDSKTPGHPEYGITPGVDCSSGPLGQGLATAIGVAMAEANLRAKYNKGKNPLIDFNTYVLCGDGDLMEGISYEAASLAGTLKLNKLIVLYDSNNICLDGPTSLTFNENIAMRFISQGWNVISVEDGNSFELISKAIEEAKTSTEKPTLIEIKTTIGKYSENAGTNKVHGAPLSKEDISNIKETLGIRDIPFAISQNTCEEFRQIINDRCQNLSAEFDRKILSLDDKTLNELRYFMEPDKKLQMNSFTYDPPEDNLEATRDTSQKILNYMSKLYPFIIGGSADLFASNKTYIKDGCNFQADNYLGKNIYFGVREHAMGAILNGLSLCGFRPYGSTFLVFSDYLKPAIRMAALMNLQNIYVFSHDSISVGEDGPTHQPVEQLLALRSLPNLEVFRPADANETIGAYKAIFAKSNGPSVISLARNKTKILEVTKANEVEKGGYILIDPIKKADAILISSGEELHLAIEVANRLKPKGIDLRVVSMPNLERFLKQTPEYIEDVLPVEIRKIVIEASSSYSWNKLIYNSKYLITLDKFGASGKYQDVYKKYGFDVDSLEEKVEELLK